MTTDSAQNGAQSSATAQFLAARDFLLERRGDYEAARAGFTWPRPRHFNWALDWFDRIAAGNHGDALRIVEDDGTTASLSFAELSARSDAAAGWLREQGVAPGDRVLVMLGNQRELWEVALGAMKLRAVVIPATPLLGPADLRDRVERGRVRHVITRAEDTAKFDQVPGTYTRIAAGPDVPAGWRRLQDMGGEDAAGTAGPFVPEGETLATDPLMLYFTSGTTARPKLVEHTHASYPIGHLSTMYWLGLRPGDVHLNIASPGWAKHAWSNLFAPWNAGATVFVHNYTRFDAERLMAEMDRNGVTTFCAPPTVWRMLIQSDLTKLRTPPREAVAAGEPLNPEVIDKVREAWGITVRDGFGQTETTLQVGNFPGVPVKPGSMGRPAPGYEIVLLDPVTGKESPDEGELCVDLRTRPAGVTTGYRDDPGRTAEAMADGLYRTGDIAARDADGYLTYIGRSDDVFKASDYKISPFELESALLEHEAVAEAAVVPAPDALRLAVPKAYVTLAAGWEPGPETARAIFEHSRSVLSPYKRIRRIEFGELPKTVSGKIRRVELRELTEAGSAGEYTESDL
ncbi:AMP-binding protein [Streptomyces sp. NPDC058662]|uniref:AMP-binding protein n=1 Tax=Streptomyces sp. NPDC058662 TaxID=3346583 RepID=UPI003663965C